MRVVLLSVPGLSPYSPPLSILSLAAYLNQNGVNAVPIDVSAGFLHYCLNPDRLAQRFAEERIEARMARVAGRRQQILERLREVWTPTGFVLTRSADDFCEVVDAAKDALFYTRPPFGAVQAHVIAGDPLTGYCEAELIPALRAAAPDLVGVSLSYASQAAGGLAIIKAIVTQLNVPVVVGGSCFYFMPPAPGSDAPQNDSVERMRPFLHPFAILGEGEKPLLELCEKIGKGHAIDNVPGLVWREDGRIRFCRSALSADMREFPLIELDQVPIGKKYLTPIRMAPLLTSRGCYWNRCAFCDHAGVIGSRWREMDPSGVYANLDVYRRKYGIEFVLFCDESTSPRMLDRLSGLISSNGLTIQFGGMARFERSLTASLGKLSAAGCRFLAFGLESGCQRIVDLMNKGFRLEDAEQALAVCKRHNIMVELFAMFGFPTEKLSEAAETIDFMERNRDNFYIVRPSPWMFSPNSPVGRNPELFGIEPAEQGGTGTFRVRDGIGQETAAGLVRELWGNEHFRDKLISHVQQEFKHEEYYVIRYLCQSGKRAEVGAGAHR